MDQVFKWAEEGIQERQLGTVCSLKYWHAVDPLPEGRHFEALLRKMNLQV